MKVVKLNSSQTIEPIEWEPYTGETIIVNTVIRKGQKIQETAYVEDKVKAVPEGNAYIIGNGPSRKNFDLESLRGSGQTYGCNALYRDFIPDFLFSVDMKITKEISDNKVYEKCWCYAPSLEVNRLPGLVLIPKNPHYTSGNQAIWTSLIHGHKNLYLLGFDFAEFGKDKLNNIYQDTENYGPRHNDVIFEQWLTQFRKTVKQRPYCHFTIVHDSPPEYLYHLQTGTDLGNTKIISYKEFKESVLNQKS